MRWTALGDYDAAAMILDTTRTPRVARLLAEDDPRTAIVARSGRFVLFRRTDPADNRTDEERESSPPSGPQSHLGDEPP